MHNPTPHSLFPVGSDPAGKVFREPIFRAPLTSSRDTILEVIMRNFFQWTGDQTLPFHFYKKEKLTRQIWRQTVDKKSVVYIQ